MEQGSWQVKQYGKTRGIQLKQFKRMRELKGGGAAWASRISDSAYISDITRKKDGAVIIDSKMLSLTEDILLCIERDFFVLKLQEITEYIVKFCAWSITAQVAGKIRRKHAFYID